MEDHHAVVGPNFGLEHAQVTTAHEAGELDVDPRTDARGCGRAGGWWSGTIGDRSVWIGWCHVRLLSGRVQRTSWCASPVGTRSQPSPPMLTNRRRRQLPDRGSRNASSSKTCGERTISGAERPDRTTELAGSPGPFGLCLETSSQYTSPDRPTVRPAGAGRTTRWHDAHSMRGGTFGGQRGAGIAVRFGILGQPVLAAAARARITCLQANAGFRLSTARK